MWIWTSSTSYLRDKLKGAFWSNVALSFTNTIHGLRTWMIKTCKHVFNLQHISPVHFYITSMLGPVGCEARRLRMSWVCILREHLVAVAVSGAAAEKIKIWSVISQSNCWRCHTSGMDPGSIHRGAWLPSGQGSALQLHLCAESCPSGPGRHSQHGDSNAQQRAWGWNPGSVTAIRKYQNVHTLFLAIIYKQNTKSVPVGCPGCLLVPTEGWGSEFTGARELCK